MKQSKSLACLSTTAPAAHHRAGAGRARTVFPVLRAWPTLAPATAVYLNVTAHYGYRVPVKILRSAGLPPEQGIRVSTYPSRALLQAGGNGGPVAADPVSKNFVLPPSSLGDSLTPVSFAIVEGPGYVIITSHEEALNLAGDAPIYQFSKWVRLSLHAIPPNDKMLPVSAVKPITWKDVTLFSSNPRCKSGVAAVGGRIWDHAGLNPGDPIRITRYKNATVVEKCTPAEKQSVLTAGFKGYARHFFGAAVIDLQNTQALRVIAAKNKLILTLPTSDIGQACSAAQCNLSITKQAPKPRKGNAFDMLALNVLAIKDLDKKGNAVDIRGNVWTVAGMDRMQPVKVTHYAHAIVIEPCAEIDMDFLLGSPSVQQPYRVISLVNTALSSAKTVRILICEDRLVLTAPAGDLGRLYSGAPKWQAYTRELTGDPVVTLNEYVVPDSRRLQIQGRWLTELGFTPGAKFAIESAKKGVVLRLVSDGDATVTEHSPGTAKLYVPTQKLTNLSTAKVRVVGRAGELRLLPLAA